MTKRKVWRYYCGFCKRTGGHAFHMARHERYCTSNPNRECHMCRHITDDTKRDYQALAQELDAGMTQIYDQQTYGIIAGNVCENEGHAEAIMEKVNHCPACFLTVMKLSKSPWVPPFDYSDAKAKWWKEDRL